MRKKDIKYFMLILISMLIFNSRPLYCHYEWVHQYIVKEAYKMLYNEVGRINYPSEMLDPLHQACGFDAYGLETAGIDHDICNGILEYWLPEDCNWEKNFPLLRGAWVEDSYDALLDYSFWNGHWDAAGGHFWQGDLGDNDAYDLNDGIAYCWNCVINSYNKAQLYALQGVVPAPQAGNDDIKIEPYDLHLVKKTLWGGSIVYHTNSVLIKYFTPNTMWEYNNIINFAKNGYVRLTGYNFTFGSYLLSRFIPAPPAQPIFNINDHSMFQGVDNKYVYSAGLLGRLCHLLADQSVPSHTHYDLHPCAPLGSWGIGADGDVYELSIAHGYNIVNGVPQEWDWNRENCNTSPWRSDQTFYAKINYNQTTAREKGGLIWEVFDIDNPYSYDPYAFSFDALHYLFYSLNQLAEVFPSRSIENGTIAGGNKNLNNSNRGVNPFLNYRFNQMSIPSDVDVAAQGDVLVNHAIRATATFMYWMAWRFGWIDQNPLCRKDHFYLQNERIFGHHIDKAYNDLEFKVFDESHTQNSGIIKAGSNVNPNTVIPQGEVVVDPSAVLTLSAEKEVTLADGFTASYGSDFTARTVPVYCTNGFGFRIASQETNENIETKDNISDEVDFQIFPNPAYNRVNIQLGFNKPLKFSLNVYNSLGEKVEELVSDENTNNYRSVAFDASSLSSGVYFVKMQTSDRTITKQLIIAR